MDNCATCGHELGVGRFCINCGQPVPGRHPDATTPSPPPPLAPTIVTPPSGQAPPAPRYPLFADQPPTILPSHEPAATMLPPVASPPPSPPPQPSSYYPPQPPSSPRRGWVLPAAAVVVVLLLVGVGLFMLTRDGEEKGRETDPVATAVDSDPPPTGSDTPSPSAFSSVPSDPGTTTAPPPTGATEDLVPLIAAIEVPGVAPPSTDARTGRRVTFDAGNLTDGDLTTAWRMAGDATSDSLTIDFGTEVEIREIGMLNGYAKKYPGYDGYRLNRRVMAANWVFDDGTEVPVQLNDDRSPQAIQIDPVTTRTVTVQILKVSAPGRGPNGKDFTAISELTFGGRRL